MISNHRGSVSIRTILLLTANAGFLIWILSARANAKDTQPLSPVSYNGEAPQAYSPNSEAEPALFIPEMDEVIEPTEPSADSQMSENDSQNMPAIPDETLNLAMFDWYENTVRYNWFPSSAQQITDVSEILGDWKGWVKYDPNNEHDTSGDFLLYLNIDAGQSDIAATCRWYWTHYHKDAEGTYDDGQSHFRGTFDNGQLYTEGPGILHIKYFCSLEGRQYGVGMMKTTDGIQAIICLMRP